ncbi:MAG: hypothetical protein ACLTEJ_02535 [Neglectibacter timonensis]
MIQGYVCLGDRTRAENDNGQDTGVMASKDAVAGMMRLRYNS